MDNYDVTDYMDVEATALITGMVTVFVISVAVF